MKPVTSRRNFQSPRLHSTAGKIHWAWSHYIRFFNATHLGGDETRKYTLDANTERLVFQSQILAEFVDESLDDWSQKKILTPVRSSMENIFRWNLCTGIKGHERSWNNSRTGRHVQDESFLALCHLTQNHDAHASHWNDVAVDDTLSETWWVWNLHICIAKAIKECFIPYSILKGKNK